MRFFSRQLALGRQFKTQGHGDYLKKNEKGSTEAENVSRNCLCKRVLFMGSLLGTHQSAMGTLFFFLLVALLESICQILTRPSFVLISKVANSFYQYSSSFSFSVPHNFPSFPWEIHIALQIGLKYSKPTGNTLFL